MIALSSRIHFALLAHNKPEMARDLISNVQAMCPTATVSLFNGGTDRQFMVGAALNVNPHSKPLKYGNLTPFAFRTFRWLADTQIDFDYLVLLDSDMMLTRPGLEEHLDTVLADSMYGGFNFQIANDPANWKLGGSTVLDANKRWESHWHKRLGADSPYWAFNPGQTFRRELVMRLADQTADGRLEKFCLYARTWALEEFVFPTLAVANGGKPVALPGAEAMRFKYHSPAEIAAFAEPGSEVYMIHKVGMSADAADRQTIHLLSRGEKVPAELLAQPAIPTPPFPPYTWKKRARRIMRRLMHPGHP